MPETEYDLEREILDRVHALAFDNRGLLNEVDRLRRQFDRIYWSLVLEEDTPMDAMQFLLGLCKEVGVPFFGTRHQMVHHGGSVPCVCALEGPCSAHDPNERLGG